MRRTVAALDLAAVVVFVAIGRASHHHPETISGFWNTLWPFAAGLAAGWVVARRLLAGRVAPESWRGGLIVSATTVAVGMLLRVVSGQGTAWAFVLVALGFLGSVMIGGRWVLASLRREPSGVRR